MASYKADAYRRILNDAQNAKPIEGMDNTYSPEDYAKIRGAELLMGKLNEGDYMKAQLDIGAAEYDEHGRLKKIGRERPALLDLGLYTANRYMVEETEETKEYDKSGDSGDGAKSTRTYKHKEIVVVMGQAIVRAIAETRELPPTVKAYRFRKTTQGNWRFLRAEFIKNEVCYSMTKTLSPEAMLKLMAEMKAGATSTNTFGDRLEDIL